MTDASGIGTSTDGSRRRRSPEQVDERRRAVGLPPLAQKLAELAAAAEHEGRRPPADWAARRAEQDARAREAGWR